MSDNFDPMDFQPNSLGVLVVRVIRIKDIVKTLSCTEDFARKVVVEIRGETSADGEVAFVLPSQLARWTYRRAGQPVPPPAHETMLVNDAGRGDVLKRAAREHQTSPVSGSTSLKEIRSDLRRLKSATIQPGAIAISIEQAAARLGCSRSRVFEFLKEGRIKRAPRTGRLTMLTLVSVDELLESPAEAKPKPPRERPTRKLLKPGAIKAEVLALKEKYR